MATGRVRLPCLLRFGRQPYGQRDLEFAEQFEAFGERLMPILAAAGIQLASPPDIFEVHNVVKG